jgi:GNAT superfamily N-acetyltransferase
MMRNRPITSDEVAAFVALTPRAEHTLSIQQYLEQMFAQGAMRIDWCFVAEADGQFVGRLAYWAPPKTGIPSDILFLDLPWEHEYRTIGTQLFRESLPPMRRLGATALGYVLDNPSQSPQWQAFPEQRHHLLSCLGFQIVRDTNRFAHDLTSMPEPMVGRLIYRSLPDVGTDAFVTAIEQVSVGTLDQLIQQQRRTYGAQGAAQMMLNILQTMEYDPAWWQLGYGQDGILVGLVMPTKSLTAGTIGYIGVVPEQRGQGYSHDLLVHGTATLLAAGINKLRADADVGNEPMAKAFRRAGYRQVGMRCAYQLPHTAWRVAMPSDVWSNVIG